MYCLVCKNPDQQPLLCESNSKDIFPEDSVVIKMGDKAVCLASVVATMPVLPSPAKMICSVVRKASQKDIINDVKAKEKASEMLVLCKEAVAALDLPMNILYAELMLTFSKYIVYFTAPTRVDFRPLIARLTSKIREAIELRQISVRSAARMNGDIGVCGQPCCCKRYMQNFQPISSKILTGTKQHCSSPKVTGICGRLACCNSFDVE